MVQGGISAKKIMEKMEACGANGGANSGANSKATQAAQVMFGLRPEAEPGHFDCVAELGDLRRRQFVRDAETREANPGDEACFERRKRTCAAELANLRRM